VALILDGFIVAIPTNILIAALGLSTFTADRVSTIDGGERVNFHWGTGGTVLSVLISLAYYGYLNGVRGQTVGKMVLKIKVIDADTGASIGLGRGLARWAIQIPLFLACGVGALLDALWPLWDKRNQAIHDKVARSVVIKV
jgi:uncharacterized RDD family membrane protein YckC